MRSGGCAVQQELAGDAAAVMRQAVTLARRRGHAQVTPLHAASAMLADAGGGLLRAACLRSRASSHPLQCKALELCFNVALNRLATAAAGGSMFPSFHAHHHHHGAPPALSNALAAAFKRAQANQRRGGVGVGVSSPEGGQHGSAARVELEQLVISILDDPGVSRVMREAGFSSADVKANVEKAAAAVMVSSSSPELSSNTAASSSTTTSPNNPKPNSFLKANKAAVDVAGDAARVLECMASGTHRCVAVVGESAEAVVKAVMDRVSKGGGDLNLTRLKHAQLVPFSAASFQGSPREEVEARAADLRALAREARAAGKGVVLVLEDLAYAAASWGRSLLLGGRCGYCPVEHALVELGGLVRGGGGHDMIWLLGFGSCATHASCRSGQPSLEAVLDLHPVIVPDGGSLGGDSEITHCGADMVVATSASFPSWMIPRCQQQSPPVLTGSELTLSFSSPASSCLGGGFAHYYNASMMNCEPWDDLTDHHHQTLPNHGHDGPIMAADTSCDQRLLLANPNNLGSSTSVSKSNSTDGATGAHQTAAARRRRPKFTELTAENLKILCGALETRVPRHREIAPAIASAVLRRRSGVTRTARPSPATWLLFRGRDSDGKAAMARELARLVFGSYAEFTCIAGSNSGDSGLKRQRSPENARRGGGYMQRFYEAIRENPHRVVMIDAGAEHVSVATSIKDAMATGMVRGCDGDVVSRLEDAIVVMSCDDQGFESRSRVSSPRPVKKQRVMTSDVDGKVEADGAEKAGAAPLFGLDLNACAAMDGEEGMTSSPNDMEILKAVDGVCFFQC
ncbi:unnamed protein product [Urochloa decumbens]|uniref:Clp R domain-containing protein n=1 Tax=Urochloa decumbens TaxID=240449 RepID=A0ABC9GNX4_9POAL